MNAQIRSGPDGPNWPPGVPSISQYVGFGPKATESGRERLTGSWDFHPGLFWHPSQWRMPESVTLPDSHSDVFRSVSALNIVEAMKNFALRPEGGMGKSSGRGLKIYRRVIPGSVTGFEAHHIVNQQVHETRPMSELTGHYILAVSHVGHPGQTLARYGTVFEAYYPEGQPDAPHQLSWTTKILNSNRHFDRVDLPLPNPNDTEYADQPFADVLRLDPNHANLNPIDALTLVCGAVAVGVSREIHR